MASEDRDRLLQYQEAGWCRFSADPELSAWLRATGPAIRQSIAAPENQIWLRYGGTWFAGVNVLPNDATGAVPGGTPLTGDVVRFAESDLGWGGIPWDAAQVSVCYPGYPQPMAGESDATFRFRRDRDAAHLDGLLKDGPDRRRFLREHHAFIFGLPVTEFDPGAAPFTIWEGSHKIVANWLRETYGGMPIADWAQIDVTEAYQTVRRTVFDTCRRVPVHARPGEAYLVHRHAIHGMARWAEGAEAAPEGRVIVYFRPPTQDLVRWLNGL